MGLRKGLQVIAQGPDVSATVRCDGFYDVPGTTAAYIAVVPDSTPMAFDAGRQLHYELLQRLGAIAGVRREGAMPCVPAGEDIGSYGCHALAEGTCRIVVVLVGDPAVAIGRAGRALLRKDAECIPLLLPGMQPQSFPSPIATRNARNWISTPIEFLPEIFAAAGITTSEQRIFISYRTGEAAALCDQLFDALNRAGFDVFVDRFRIAVGADFQQRILEELAHKSMVLFLETAGILDSPWTRYEAAVAKSSRLGILALHIPGGVRIPDIDDSRRINVTPGWHARRKKLTSAMLDDVVARVRRDHAFYDIRRRQLLRDSMRRALQKKGVTSQTLLPSGAIEATSNGQTYVLWLPSRPAELSDFHHVAETGGSGTPVRAIFGPASHMIGRARERMRWLATTTKISSFDESEMERKATVMAAGRPL